MKLKKNTVLPKIKSGFRVNVRYYVFQINFSAAQTINISNFHSLHAFDTFRIAKFITEAPKVNTPETLFAIWEYLICVINIFNLVEFCNLLIVQVFSALIRKILKTPVNRQY